MPIGDSTARCGCGRLGCWEASIGLHAVLAVPTEGSMLELDVEFKASVQGTETLSIAPLAERNAIALDSPGPPSSVSRR